MKLQINNGLFITDNSSEVDGNTIFLSTKTSEKYEDDAKKRGCEEVITPESLKNYFDTNIKIIGITGTNGKTTTAGLIYSILLDLGYKVAMQGTRGFFINEEKVEGKSLTTPQVLGNYHHLDLAVKAGCEFFVMEVSSHAIEQERIAGMEFALKIHTNITKDHLDYHNTVEEYAAIKNSFFTDGGPNLFNADDTMFKAISKNSRSYAIEGAGTYKLEAYSFNYGLAGIISFGGERQPFSSPMIGFFNLYNITAAVAAVHMITGRKLEEICEQVENFAGVSGRMEVVSRKPFIFVDFAHTEDGVLQVLRSLEPMKVVTVIGAGGDRDKTKREPMGKLASFYSTRVYITSDNPRSEDPETIIDEIAKGMSETKEFHKITDRKEAIETAIKNLKENELLAILGRGDEEYQEINGEFIPLNDKKIIMEYLEKNDY